MVSVRFPGRALAVVLVCLAVLLLSPAVPTPEAEAAACTVPTTQGIRGVNVTLDECLDRNFTRAGQTYEIHVFWTERALAANTGQCDNNMATPAPFPQYCEHALTVNDNVSGQNVQAAAMAAEMETAWRFYLDRGLTVVPGGGREMNLWIAADNDRIAGVPTTNGVNVDDEQIDNNDQLNKRILAFHEINHLVQFNYDSMVAYGTAGISDGFFLEGNARAGEDRVDTPLDLDTGHLFIPEMQGLLNNDGLRRSSFGSYDYPSAMFWVWLWDQYRAAGDVPPVEGWAALRAFYEEMNTETNQVTALRNWIAAQGSTFNRDFLDWTLSLWAYRRAPADRRLTYLDTEIRTATTGLANHTVRMGSPGVATDSPMVNARSAQYWEYQPNAGCEYVSFQFDGNSQTYGFSVLTGNGATLPNRWTSTSTGWARTVRTAGLDRVAGVVTGLDNTGTVDVTSGCVQPTLNIARPTTAAFSMVGSAADPRRFLVRVEVRGPGGAGVAGLTADAFDVSLRPQGAAAAIAAAIVSTAYVQNDYWLLVQAPNAAAGAANGSFYDTVVTLGSQTDTEVRSVLYADQGPQDVVVVLDRSGSMGGGTGKIEAARNAASLLANELANTDLGGYVAFSDAAELREELALMSAANQRADLIADIAAEAAAGGTAIGAGMQTAANEETARGVADHRCSFVLLSDGEENRDPRWATVRDQVADNGCAIHAVALGPQANEPLMQQIAASVAGGSYDYATTSGDVPISTRLAFAAAGSGAIGWANGLSRVYDYSAAQIGDRQRLFSRAGSREVTCADATTTINFSDLPAGSGEIPTDPIFRTVTTGGVPLTGEDLRSASGEPIGQGFGVRGRAARTGGSPGGELENNNILFDYGFGATGCALTLRYSDDGGLENLRVNGELRTVQSLAELDGATIGGVAVGAAQSRSGVGTLNLTGTIRSFAIGGQELTVDDVVLTRSAPEVQTFVVDPTTDRLVLSLAWQAPSGNTQVTTLTDPSGDVIDVSLRRQSPTQTNEVWEIANPEPGQWGVQVAGLNQEYLLGATARTDVELLPLVGTPENQRTAGVEVPIVAAFVGESGPLLGADVTASVRDPLGFQRSLRLYDDGLHDDTDADDGVYGNTYTSTSYAETVIPNPVEGAAAEAVGSYLVEFVGISGDDRREAQASFAIAAGEDPDGDGIATTWEVTHGFDPNDPDDAQADGDGDGLSAICEYQAGTDPRTGDTDEGGEGDGSEVAVIPLAGLCVVGGDRDPLDPGDDRVDRLPTAEAEPQVDAGAPVIVITWQPPEEGELISVDIACRTVDADGNPTGEWVVIADDVTGTQYVWRDGVLGQRYQCRVTPTIRTLDGTELPGRETLTQAVAPTTDPVPPTGRILIDGGAPATADLTVALSLSATDGGFAHDASPESSTVGTAGDLEMRMSNTGDFTDVAFEPFRAEVPDWDLGDVAPGEVATVYVQFRDAAGNVSGSGMGWVDTILYAPTERFSGPTRIETAIDIAQGDFDDGQAGVALLARADTFPDALAGTPLAVAEGGPILLTDTTGLNPTTAAELQRVLLPGRTVYLLGSEGALSPDVDSAVQVLGFRTVRLGGPSRIETAIVIADHLGAPNPLLITTGFDFPDALAAGAAAAANGGAVLLTTSGARHPATDAYLAAHAETTTVYAVGNPASDPYAEAEAVSGATREDTAVAVAETFFTLPRVVGVARRDVFADALTGGPHVARLGGPVLLTPSEALHPAPSAYACRARVSASGAFLYGGQAAVSDAVADAVRARLAGDGC